MNFHKFSKTVGQYRILYCDQRIISLYFADYTIGPRILKKKFCRNSHTCSSIYNCSTILSPSYYAEIVLSTFWSSHTLFIILKLVESGLVTKGFFLFVWAANKKKKHAYCRRYIRHFHHQVINFIVSCKTHRSTFHSYSFPLRGAYFWPPQVAQVEEWLTYKRQINRKWKFSESSHKQYL